MAKNKIRRVVMAPHTTRQARANQPNGRARSTSNKAVRKGTLKTWHTSDVDFDSRGRLLILNPQLSRRIARNVSDDGKIHLVVRAEIRDGPPPIHPPTDAMCGCKAFTLQLTKVERINRRGNK